MGGAVSVTADNKSANCDEMSRNLSTKRSAKGQSKRVPDRSMRMSCRIQSIHVHDDAHSFRSKAGNSVWSYSGCCIPSICFDSCCIGCNTNNMLLIYIPGTVKMLIKNRLSRQAFHTFLEFEHAGNDQLLSAYLVFEGIKKDSKKELTTAKTKLCAAMYSIKHTSSAVLNEAERVENQIYLITQGLRDDVISLTIVDLERKLSQAQDEMLLIMTPFYDRFLKSASYKEFEVTNKAKERRSYNENTSSLGTLGRQSSELVDSRRTSDLTASRRTSNQNPMSRQTSIGTTMSRRASISSVGRYVSDGRMSISEELPATGTVNEDENKAEITLCASDPVPISDPSKAGDKSPNNTDMTSDQHSLVTDLKEYEPTVPHLSTVPECAA